LDCLSKEQLYQISKFLNNWTPTLHHQATQDNSIDRRCVPSMAGNHRPCSPMSKQSSSGSP
jgi:hypothetical protein